MKKVWILHFHYSVIEIYKRLPRRTIGFRTIASNDENCSVCDCEVHRSIDSFVFLLQTTRKMTAVLTTILCPKRSLSRPVRRTRFVFQDFSES